MASLRPDGVIRRNAGAVIRITKYYGHDVELTIAGKHYFLEWNDAGIELYLMVNGEGTKISSISALNKSDILAELFEFMFVEQKNLNNSYADFEIVDIE